VSSVALPGEGGGKISRPPQLPPLLIETTRFDRFGRKNSMKSRHASSCQRGGRRFESCWARQNSESGTPIWDSPRPRRNTGTDSQRCRTHPDLPCPHHGGDPQMAIAPRWSQARGLKGFAMTLSEVGSLWGHFGPKGRERTPFLGGSRVTS
jgi:hypothetical protein